MVAPAATPAFTVHGVPVTEEQRDAGLAAMVGRFRWHKVVVAMDIVDNPHGFVAATRLLQSERKAGRIRYVKGWWERVDG